MEFRLGMKRPLPARCVCFTAHGAGRGLILIRESPPPPLPSPPPLSPLIKTSALSEVNWAEMEAKRQAREER